MQYHPAASAYSINIPSSIHQKHLVEKQKKKWAKTTPTSIQFR